ncbi:MAG TPA: phage holin family protein [Polyangia bacterium]|nr:phage holin family protein [Polyangia bacterium]
MASARMEESGQGNGQHRRLATGALVREIASGVERLAKKQVELAKTELRADLKKEARVAGGLGVAALAALITVNLLLVTAALALSLVMPAWGAGLVVSGFTLLVAAIVGLVSWSARLRQPMSRTRQTLKDDVTRMREQLA